MATEVEKERLPCMGFRGAGSTNGLPDDRRGRWGRDRGLKKALNITHRVRR